jgi:type VI secretion system protein ImpC
MSAPQQAQAAAAQAGAGSLLDEIMGATRVVDDRARGEVKKSVEELVKQLVKPGQVVSRDTETTIKAWINEIDKKLSSQLNEVMHAPEFQKLESTWRGLSYLVFNTETSTTLKIRVMNATKRDLLKDLEKAVEFDQSTLFKKVYEEEYGQLGGEPYGMLVGDYEFTQHPEDVSLLKLISNVAAASHSPFVAATAPQMLNLESFQELAKPRDLAKIFMGAEYTSWRSFRESEDARYVALTMPRVLARLPYGEKTKKVEEFNFEEKVDGQEHNRYLWMNAAWAYSVRITDAVAKFGWMARSRGVEGGGKVEGLPIHTFPTDDGEMAAKCPTEIAIADRREYELSNLGFLPLLHYKNRDCAVFMGAQSCQKPKEFVNPNDNANAQLSAKFNYIMCVSRFAHYLKVMVRDKVGSFMEASECKVWLNNWINQYVIENPESAGDELKARCPLAKASVEVEEVKGRPGHYRAVARLRPHYQLEAIDVSLRLVAQMKGGG